MLVAPTGIPAAKTPLLLVASGERRDACRVDTMEEAEEFASGMRTRGTWKAGDSKAAPRHQARPDHKQQISRRASSPARKRLESLNDQPGNHNRPSVHKTRTTVPNPHCRTPRMIDFFFITVLEKCSAWGGRLTRQPPRAPKRYNAKFALVHRSARTLSPEGTRFSPWASRAPRHGAQKPTCLKDTFHAL